MNNYNANAKTIEKELEWFHELILLRGKITFEQSVPEEELYSLKLPSISHPDSPYAALIRKFNMNFEERLVLILALIPHIKPSLLDLLHMKNELYDIPFTEFGGIRHEKHKGYLPTGETAIFLLAGNNISRRFELLRLFEKEHFFQRFKIISLEGSSPNEPLLSGQLKISPEYLALCTNGNNYKPDFNPNFPAKRFSTEQDWEDLIVPEHIFNGLEKIKEFILYGKTLKNDFRFGKKIRPGFRVLFTGPPGTGKTLTASLIGKQFQMDVYRIDLSMVVSKYIGETEKNLSLVFDLAESKDWILFFDEADALFGKRSSTGDSHERYANQEVSYLLQRIEDFDGLVILSSNFKKNIDEAFFRRFQLILDFEIPDVYHRYILWQRSKTNEFEYDLDVNLELISEKHELSAASIINILHYCTLKCLSRNDRIIKNDDILDGLKIEKIKEGKSIL